MHDVGRIAVGVSALAVVTALLLVLFALVRTADDSQLWVLIAILVIPSSAGIWFFARRTRPTPFWIFIWILTLAVGASTVIASVVRVWRSSDPEGGFATTAIAVLAAVQAAVCLWADTRQRAQSSK